MDERPLEGGFVSLNGVPVDDHAAATAAWQKTRPAHPLRCLLVSTARNEGPYLLEWIAYHRAIGFTDIVICTNDCVDGSPALLDRLQELGVVTHIRSEVAPGEEPQLVAYRRAERLPAVEEADWIMVLDADEFLNVHVGAGTVADLIEAVPDATAFLINWRVFGNSGRRRWSPGSVCRRFTRAAERTNGVNISFKTLFTRADLYQCKLLPHGPGYADEGRLEEVRCVNGEGDPLSERFARARTFLQSEPDRVSWRLAQVNHYNTRSWEDYLVKHDRGGGLNLEWERDWSWNTFNRNEEEDTSIWRNLDKAEPLLHSLLADAEVRERHARCCKLYGRHVRALKPGTD